MGDSQAGDASREPEDGATTGGTITSFRRAAARRQRAAPSPHEVPGRFPEPSPHHNLPLQLTTFVGRERALAELGRLLARTRLLTLTGAPGVGKTRLALQLAGEALDAFADGVWLVELAPLADAALVPQVVAEVLGVQEQPGRPLPDTLADALRHQQLLLILDNCEHLVAACAVLAERLLRNCPQLEILATSREALGIAGETIWPAPSLTVPTDAESATADVVATHRQSEAVELFLERARAATPTFTLTERNASAVAQICRRLDGIALALELAAARLRALPVEELAARLEDAIDVSGQARADDRFRLLTGGSRAALPRQQTLRAAVDWSHALLSDPERIVLPRLAVFAGGWTLEAAEEVCSGDGITGEDVLDLLAQLVNKSLVVAEAPAGEQRYRLLETLREYGWEKLREAGEEEILRTRHVAWLVGLAERVYTRGWGADQAAWQTRLQAEHDNLRVALAWSKIVADRAEPWATETVRLALDLARTLWRFWQTSGHPSEAYQWLTDVLARTDARTTERALACRMAGYLAMLKGDFPAASALLQEALALGRETGHAYATTVSLLLLGALAMMAGDLVRAEGLMDQSLAPLHQVADERDRYVATTVSMYWRVELARFQGEYDRAIGLVEEGLTLVRGAHDSWSIAFGLAVLGRLTWLTGDVRRATALQRESLILRRELQDRYGITICLEGLAWAANSDGRPERAARLFGAAEAVRERIGAGPWPLWLAEHERNVAATRAGLGEEAFAAAWTAGRALSVDDAIAVALGDAEPAPRSPAPTMRRGASSPAGPLSRREHDVAALIAAGQTNRQIAEQLVISEWTVDTHVRHILTKLNFRSRAQVAAWVTEQGLAASNGG